MICISIMNANYLQYICIDTKKMLIQIIFCPIFIQKITIIFTNYYNFIISYFIMFSPLYRIKSLILFMHFILRKVLSESSSDMSHIYCCSCSLKGEVKGANLLLCMSLPQVSPYLSTPLT